MALHFSNLWYQFPCLQFTSCWDCATVQVLRAVLYFSVQIVFWQKLGKISKITLQFQWHNLLWDLFCVYMKPLCVLLIFLHFVPTPCILLAGQKWSYHTHLPKLGTWSQSNLMGLGSTWETQWCMRNSWRILSQPGLLGLVMPCITKSFQ